MLKNKNQQSVDQFQMQNLNLDFKKKQNKKSSTDRPSHTNFNASKTIDLIDYSSTKKSQTPNKSDKQNLIQKKKSYAEQIRQRNMNQLQNKKKKKINDQNEFSQLLLQNQSARNLFSKDQSSYSLKHQPMCNAFKQTNRILAPSCSKNNSKVKKADSFDQNQKLFQNPISSKKVSTNLKVNLFQSQNSYATKHISKSASRYLKQKKQLVSLQSMYFNQSIKFNEEEDFQQNKSLMIYFTPNNDREIVRNIETSCFLQPTLITPIQQLSAIQKIDLNSNTYSLKILPSQQHQRRNKQVSQQISLLTKQNCTFKKQLAQFRKQNGLIKKQLDNSKSHIKNLQKKAEQLLQNQKQYKQSLQMNNNRRQGISQQKYQKQNLDGIIQQTNQQLFSLKNQNKHLQMKVYMLQKKLYQEEEANKKKTAVEINRWKEKYNQMRFQLLRIKNQKSYSSDWSISMDISRDQ